MPPRPARRADPHGQRQQHRTDGAAGDRLRGERRIARAPTTWASAAPATWLRPPPHSRALVPCRCNQFFRGCPRSPLRPASSPNARAADQHAQRMVLSSVAGRWAASSSITRPAVISRLIPRTLDARRRNRQQRQHEIEVIRTYATSNWSSKSRRILRQGQEGHRPNRRAPRRQRATAPRRLRCVPWQKGRAGSVAAKIEHDEEEPSPIVKDAGLDKRPTRRLMPSRRRCWAAATKWSRRAGQQADPPTTSSGQRQAQHGRGAVVISELDSISSTVQVPKPDHGCRVLPWATSTFADAPCALLLELPCVWARCAAPSNLRTRLMQRRAAAACRACGRTGGWCCSTVMLRLPRGSWPMGAIGCSPVTCLQARCEMSWRHSSMSARCCPLWRCVPKYGHLRCSTMSGRRSCGRSSRSRRWCVQVGVRGPLSRA